MNVKISDLIGLGQICFNGKTHIFIDESASTLCGTDAEKRRICNDKWDRTNTLNTSFVDCKKCLAKFNVIS